MFQGIDKKDQQEGKRKAISASLSFSMIGGALLALIFIHPDVQEVIQEELPVEVKFFQAAPLHHHLLLQRVETKQKRKKKKRKRRKRRRKSASQKPLWNPK